MIINNAHPIKKTSKKKSGEIGYVSKDRIELMKFTGSHKLSASTFIYTSDHARKEQLISLRNIEQALAALSEQGLTRSMLENNWTGPYPNNVFFDIHKQLLVYLITGQKVPDTDLENAPELKPEQLLNPLDAVLEINKLTFDQCKTLAMGFANGMRGESLRESLKAEKQVGFSAKTKR